MRDRRKQRLDLTRDHSPTLTRKGKVHPCPSVAASVKGFQRGLLLWWGVGRSPAKVMGAKPLCKPPFWAGFLYSKNHACQEINTRIYFAFFVAPSGVILSSILLDNRSLWGILRPPIEGRWSLSVLPS